jgi:outer membrane protein insertion porin family
MRRLVSWFFLMCTCFAILPVMGSDRVVSEIVVRDTGVGYTDRSYVMARIQSREGEEIVPALVGADVRALLQTGQFTAVDANVEQTDEGIRLIFAVYRKYRLVSAVRVIGNERFSDRKILKWLALESGEMVDDQIMGVKSLEVIKKYREKGYGDVSVSWDFVVKNPDRGTAKAILVIDEGPERKLEGVTVSGNVLVSTADLRPALKRSAPWNPLGWFSSKQLDRFDLAEIRAGVQSIYLDRGFLDVKVTVTPGGEEAENYAEVSIAEGEQYHVASVSLEGNERYETDLLMGMVDVSPGAVASYGRIYASSGRIQKYYGSRGYMSTRVQPLIEPNRDAQTVGLRFRIREGELVRIRDIEIRGNTRTRDKVIRREVLVYPGQVYDERRVDRSRNRLMNLGFFDNVTVRPQGTSQPSQRDLIFDVSEKRTGQFMVGAGFSSIDNLMGFLEISQGNFDLFGWPYFTGGGQKLRLRAEASSQRTDYLLSFTEPWFMDRKLSLNTEIYRRERDYDEYTERRTGFSVGVAKALPWANRIGIRYRLEDLRLTDLGDTNTYYHLESYDFESDTGEPYSFVREDDYIRSSLRVSLTHDTRNRAFAPSRGTKFEVFGEAMGGPMGFDLDLYDVGVRSRTYVPLWLNHVLSVRLKYETVESYGDTDEVPIAERLYLGGGRTMRGFEYRSVGPKVIRKLDSGEYYARPIGGQSLALASVEYTIPIVRSIRLAGFYDVGNVWSDPMDFKLDRLARSAGVGVRLDMPGFPIRIDRAWVLESDDDYTEEDAWAIWIGGDF